MSSYEKRRRNPVYRALFLDVLFEPRTRPIFIYAFIVIGVGAALYHWLEGWSWLDSFYFVVVTLTTIGYGDFAPTTPLTKLITIFYGLNGVILLLMLFDVVRSVRKWNVGERPLVSDEVD
jgi:voltage-gated potassium channel